LATIQTVVAADNAGSRGVLHRAGFTELGALGSDDPVALLGYQWRFANHGE
jgi:RimJ/RimL family protein N-acetyltransferase